MDHNEAQSAALSPNLAGNNEAQSDALSPSVLDQQRGAEWCPFSLILWEDGAQSGALSPSFFSCFMSEMCSFSLLFFRLVLPGTSRNPGKSPRVMDIPGENEQKERKVTKRAESEEKSETPVKPG